MVRLIGGTGIAGVAVWIASCGPAADTADSRQALPEGVLTEQTLTEEARQAVEGSADSALSAFREAQISRDGEAALAHLWPGFYMYQDGQRAEYAEVVAQIQATMPQLQSVEMEWTNLRVQALTPSLALTSFEFRDSIVTAGGDLLQSQGPTTLLWERRGTEWRIIYGDADHYPVEPR